jgi:hypothetical protein
MHGAFSAGEAGVKGRRSGDGEIGGSGELGVVFIGPQFPVSSSRLPVSVSRTPTRFLVDLLTN